jgi:hypothetical protein
MNKAADDQQQAEAKVENLGAFLDDHNSFRARFRQPGEIPHK